MTRRTLASVALALSVSATAVMSSGAQTPAPQAVEFSTSIGPLLAGKCLSCHGDALKLSGLDLRTRESAMAGGAHGSALVPGNAEQSRLYRMVAGLERPAMPMQGTALTAVEIAALKRWIDEGAPWDAAPASATNAAGAPAPFVLENRPISDEERNRWAFTRPRQASPPTPARKNLTNPIDRFLERAREEHGLSAAPGPIA